MYVYYLIATKLWYTPKRRGLRAAVLWSMSKKINFICLQCTMYVHTVCPETLNTYIRT